MRKVIFWTGDLKTTLLVVAPLVIGFIMRGARSKKHILSTNEQEEGGLEIHTSECTISSTGAHCALLNLTEECIAGITSFLPIETLMDMRCANRKLADLVISKEFMLLHQCFSKSKGTLVAGHLNSEVYQIKFEPRNPQPALELGNNPWHDYPFHVATVIGSNEGVLCSHISNRGLIIWNPFTAKSHHVPASPSQKTLKALTSNFVYGFLNCEVILISVDPHSNSVITEVYNMYNKSWVGSKSSRTWRLKGSKRQVGVFAKKRFNFLGFGREKDHRGEVVTMDLTDRSYAEIQLPAGCLVTHSTSSICVLCDELLYCERLHCGTFSVWKLGQEEWENMMIILAAEIVAFIGLPPSNRAPIIPILYSSGRLLCHYNKQCLLWYNLKQGEVIDMVSHDLRGWYNVHKYHRTLVPVPTTASHTQASRVDDDEGHDVPEWWNTI